MTYFNVVSIVNISQKYGRINMRKFQSKRTAKFFPWRINIPKPRDKNIPEDFVLGVIKRNLAKRLLWGYWSGFH